MQTPRSFTKLYWLAWLAALGAFTSSLAFYGGEAPLTWFALFSGLLGGFAFNFEFGRLMGFLKSRAPSFYTQLPNSRWFEVSAFFNPTLLHLPDTGETHYGAMQVYRSAWQFSVVAMFLPLLINWVAKAYAL